jgi:putative membrane-bound dehydrogenase-like protein
MTSFRVFLFLCALFSTCLATNSHGASLRAGAARIDISPRDLPVIINGGFLEGTASSVVDPIHARALALKDDTIELVMVVVDSCMLPREVCDQAKVLASATTGIPTDHMLISATHAHSVPSTMDYCLGSRADVGYTRFLIPKLAQAIETAHANLQPARLGWSVADAAEFTKNRRWITRPDKMGQDPFGDTTVRAMMHPGHLNPDYVGPSGPVDPWLSVLSVQTDQGRPLAFLGNLSMHYFGGHPGVSADYCGRFAALIEQRMPSAGPDFVAILSQGTSGDLWWGDYSLPAKQSWDIDTFTGALADLAMAAWRTIEHRTDPSLAMAQSRLTLDRRMPDSQRLEWAREKTTAMNGRRPANRPEVYAEQAVFIHENPSEEILLQAIRVGDLGITAIPNEVYALTGLKLKSRSPLPGTFNISLANGASGYIPPPEQHALGGYTTWPARTAGLEVQAEPKIVDAVLSLLEQVAAAPRRETVEFQGSYSRVIQADQPVLRWNLGEQERRVAGPSIQFRGQFLGNVAFHLPGVGTEPFGGGHRSHSVHFAGGKLAAETLERPASYSVELWFWSGMPNTVRGTTGTLFDFGGDVVAISGTDSAKPGRLTLGHLSGTTEIQPRQWQHIVLVRHQSEVTLYLNGMPEPEFHGETAPPRNLAGLFIAGDRSDRANFEGRIDEVAMYDHALTHAQVSLHFESAGTTDSPPLSPSESAAKTHVRDGYVLELVAAEPMVMDPVAIDWGADGKLWVAEMADYPYGMDGQGKPGGRIRYLVDADGDGQYERSQLFLDGINFPTSVMPWRNGVLVTAAPDLLYAEDRDGDGRAEIVERLFHGFMEGNQQLRVNSLRWGLDNWVYAASGGHHAGFGSRNAVTHVGTGRVIPLGSRDFRFRPDTGELEPQSGPSQFGRVRDDWGNWFGVQNSFPIWHYVLPDHYLRRNPDVAAPDPRKQLRLPPNPKVFMNKPPQKRFHSFEQSGRYTSACGPSIYRDDLLFPVEPGVTHAFTCEPFHNVVQHHILTEDGVSFSGRRADEDGDKDFFASADRWSRPVMTRTGPDGALYVVDMYRYMIEHPDWLPANGRSELKPYYRAGEKFGRIYRIRPGSAALRKLPPMADTRDWMDAIQSPNGRVRDMAHQRIVESGDTSLAAGLATLAGKHTSARVRLQALAALDGLGGATELQLLTALADPDPSVRTQGLRLAEPLSINHQSLLLAMTRLVGDPSPRVQLQAALSFGSMGNSQAGVALAQLAGMDSVQNDPYAVAAVLSSAGPHYPMLASRLVETPAYTGALLAMGSHRSGGMQTLLSTILDAAANRIALLTQWLDALERQGSSWAQFQSEADTPTQPLLPRVNALLLNARAQAANPEAAADVRTSTFGLLGREPALLRDDAAILQACLGPQYDQALQDAALRNLRRMNHSAVGTSLLAGWKRYSPETRSRVLDALASRSTWTRMLLDAVAEDTVAATDIEPARRQRLTSHSDKSLSELAKRVLQAPTEAGRQDVLASFTGALQLKGNADQGKTLFANRCATCHRIGDLGTQVGPDLRSITDRSRQGLLASIIDPSQSVEPKYLGYSAVLQDGESLYGLIATETANSIIFRLLDGTERTLARASLESLESSRLSFMPSGLEEGLSLQAMADLLEFVSAP